MKYHEIGLVYDSFIVSVRGSSECLPPRYNQRKLCVTYPFRHLVAAKDKVFACVSEDAREDGHDPHALLDARSHISEERKKKKKKEVIFATKVIRINGTVAMYCTSATLARHVKPLLDVGQDLLPPSVPKTDKSI